MTAARAQHDATDPALPQRLAATPHASAWVAASAGSGKTKVLTDRILRLLLAGSAPERILCLTFTKAAAAQMHSRLLARLLAWATLPREKLAEDLRALFGQKASAAETEQARKLFAIVLDCPGGMKIQTIHAFCRTLLARFPVEANLPPQFDLLDDATAAARRNAAENTILSCAAQEPASDLGKAVALLATRLADRGFQELRNELIGARDRIEAALSRMQGAEGVAAQLRRRLGLQEDDSAGKLLDRYFDDAALDLPALRSAVAAIVEAGSAAGRGKAQKLARHLENFAGRRKSWEDYYGFFYTQKNEPRKSFCTKPVIAKYPQAEDALRRECERLAALKPKLADLALAEETEAMLRLGQAMLAAYEGAKRARAELDYTDLIRAAADLLDRRDAAAWVLYKLDRGIDHLLIDEAQDTSAAQWRIVKALTGEFFAGDGSQQKSENASSLPRSLFVVGDGKQSIYGFQGAAPHLFHSMQIAYRDEIRAAARELHIVDMNVSFRSAPAVLAMVDTVFAPESLTQKLLGGDLGSIIHQSWRAGQAGLVELWPLIEAEAARQEDSEDSAESRPFAMSAQRRLAEAIAAQIAHMIGSHDMLQSAQRPVEPGDILILLRKRDVLMHALIRALKQRGIACAGADRMALLDQIAIVDLLALGDFMLLPDDDLTLAALLKSPLFGVTEDELFLLCHGRAKDESLWQRLRMLALDGSLSGVTQTRFAASATYLGNWLARADYIRPYEFLAEALNRPCPADALSGRRAFLARLGGEILEPLADLLDLALAYEAGKAPTLQGFLGHIRRAGGMIKREAAEDSSGAANGGQVRLMTIHGAKGLQSPIVILAGMTQKNAERGHLLFDSAHAETALPLYACTSLARLSPFYQRLLQERRRLSEEEYARLLYVALTRAGDRLYICGSKPRRDAKPVSEGWYGWTEAAFAGRAESHPLPPHLAPWMNGEIRRMTSPQTAAPDHMRAQTGAVQAASALESWITLPPAPEPQPARPLAPSKLEGEEQPVLSPKGPLDRARFRRGELLHKMMQILPDLPKAGRAAAAQRLLKLELPDLSQQERAAFADEALRLFDHPALAPLMEDGAMAEVPIAGLVNGRVISGQIDRLRITEDTVLLADYKTNRTPPATIGEVPRLYLAQMRAYAQALRAIYPTRKIKAALIWTAGPSVMELPEELLLNRAE